MAGQSKFHKDLTPHTFDKAAFIQKVNSEINKKGSSIHDHVRCILELRDQFTDYTNRPGNLKNCYQCIYIIFHLHSRKVYIGQTVDDIFKRFTFHRGSAREVARHEDNHFYSYLKNYGLGDIYLLPLQIIRGSFARRHTRSSGLPFYHDVAATIEQQWIDRFAAHPQFSVYNSSSAWRCNTAAATAPTHTTTASNGNTTATTVTTPITTSQEAAPSSQEPIPSQPSQSPSQPSPRGARGRRRGGGRRFISRIYDEKIRTLIDKLNNKSLLSHNLDFFTTYFLHYAIKTLQKILSFLQNTSAFSLRIAAAAHSNLRSILEAVIAARFPPRNDVFTTYKLIKIPGEYQPYMDHLNLSAVFHRSKHLLPAGATLKPIISSSFTKPISTTFFNTHTIARFSPATITSILSSPCACSSTTFQPYVHAALGHVCTHDVNILPTSSLRSLAKMGTNYRLGLTGFTVTADIRAEALELALQAFTKFSARYEHGLKIDNWDAWRDSLPASIQEQIDLNLPLGKTFTIPDSISGLSFTMDDFHALRQFQRHFAITAVDKAAMSFVFMCKKDYVNKMINDLNDSTVFQPVNTTPTALMASLDAAIPAVARHVLTLGSGTIPNYVCTMKLHKPIPQPRFIVSASDCYNTPIAMNLCTLLAALDQFTKLLLDDVFTKLDNHLSSHPSTSTTPAPAFTWHLQHTILRNASDMVVRCQEYNALHTHAPVEFQTGDVSRLYTSLDLNSVFTRLMELYTTIFDNYGYAIKVFDTPRKKPQWMSSYTPTSDRRGGSGYDKHTIFTLADLEHLLEFVIKKNYMNFAGKISHQTKGISMGGNASVYVANHFLFTYELDFYSQLVQQVTSSTALQTITSLPTTEPPNWQLSYTPGSVSLYLLNIFQWLFRFIDDTESINNNYMDKLLYTNQTFFGVNGIYPPELLITLSDKKPYSDYLDITISSRDDNGRSPIKTTFYNKFSKPEFAALSVIRYTHNSSNLARRIKDNILTGRFHALRRNITDKGSFCESLAKIMAQLINRGHNNRRLSRHLFQLLKDYPFLYGDVPRTTYQRVKHLTTILIAENSL
jgi:hypothetical protein